MEAKREEPFVVIEGIEKVIRRDLDRHKAMLERTRTELSSFQQALSYQITRKRHYKGLIRQKNKYDNDALKRSIREMNVDVRHYEDKVNLALQKIEHHELIIRTLTQQLADQERALDRLAEIRKQNRDASTNRLGQSANPDNISNN